ncbi:MAG TPA: CAP domain-containing protein [Solirubrobacteraceae bacterium]|nr:CAP domain-containing protein [Solirubrobacteraceae bacterium]
MRPGALALILLALSAAPAGAQAEDEDPLLPPARACRGATNVEAHFRTQRLAMHCLINLVRVEAGLRKVRSSAPLRHSATYKARRIAACKTFTHSPCGDDLAAPFHEADVTKGRPWYVGENLGWRKLEEATAYELLRGWLASPTHRKVLLDRRFTHLGVRRRRLRMNDLPSGIVIWVAHLGTPKKRRS